MNHIYEGIKFVEKTKKEKLSENIRYIEIMKENVEDQILENGKSEDYDLEIKAYNKEIKKLKKLIGGLSC